METKSEQNKIALHHGTVIFKLYKGSILLNMPWTVFFVLISFLLAWNHGNLDFHKNTGLYRVAIKFLDT